MITTPTSDAPRTRPPRAARGVLAAALLAMATALPVAAHAQGTLRIGMTAADIPLTTGQADQGGEGQRFMANTVYDQLVMWDLSSADKPSVLVPGLATSWSTDAKDRTKWTFKLRPGVKFHDGSTFDAQAVVWNIAKLLDEKSPQFDPKQAAQGRSRIPSIASARAVDATTVEIVTKEPDAFVPYQLAWIPMSSPAHWEKAGRDWGAYGKAPSGTGPWKLVSWTPRERAELVPNPDYWDKARVPKLDRLVLVPLPEANTRVAALRSGQVDWIEAPPPDAVASLKGASMKIVTNAYPHNWVWHLSMLEGSPFRDPKVRAAINYAIDREGLNQFLGGLSLPAKGFMPPGHAWFGKAAPLKYDPAAAKKLLAEAGYTAAKPLTLKVLIPSSGSGMMQPIPMNEFMQQNLRDVGVKVDLEVLEWNALLGAWRGGAKDAANRGAVALNYSYFIQDPFTAFVRHVRSDLVSPKGTNWGWYQDKEMDALLAAAQTSFDATAQTAALQKLHEKFVADQLFVMVTHDVNARAMSPKVQGFVQAQNWFQNFSGISMAK
ncbi:MAG TPA: ABC transporter substrate-binding protein [Burkholderiaceae bacterium]|nr:ABC transporter substrate-binding protein [Burkholderiaceae bacterium]